MLRAEGSSGLLLFLVHSLQLLCCNSDYKVFKGSRLRNTPALVMRVLNNDTARRFHLRPCCAGAMLAFMMLE